MATTMEEFQQVRVTHRRDLAPDLWTLRLRPGERLVFQPGQYATLGLEEGEEILERPYSIVSSPTEDEVEFFFELVPHGGLTPALYRMQPGETLLMRRQAHGQFTFDDQSGHTQHFFVATVTGIAPFVSMVRNMAERIRAGHPPGHRMMVLHGASRSWEFAYLDELETLARDSDWFCYVPTISRPWQDPDWKGEIGRCEDVLRKYLDSHGFEPASTTAYLCGQPEMIVNATAVLERKGFSKTSIRQEIYWVPREGDE